MRVDAVDLALVGGAHGAARAVDDVLGVKVLLAAQLGEFAETGLEDAFHAAGAVAVVDRALVQVVEVAAAPEVALELLGLRLGFPDGEPLAEDVVPRHEGDAGEDGHDALDDRAGIEDQVQDGEILRDVHWMDSS